MSSKMMYSPSSVFYRQVHITRITSPGPILQHRFTVLLCKNRPFQLRFPYKSKSHIHPSPPLVIVVNESRVESLPQPLSLIIHIMDSTCTAVHFGMRQRSLQNKLAAIDEPFFLSMSSTITTSTRTEQTSRSILEPGRGTGEGRGASSAKGSIGKRGHVFVLLTSFAPCRNE